ncbi:UNVERIFIED_CONTAM: hypothetical protein Sradi_6504800 [Sesamum radiatum]|uniref:Uncharacterized protein n=1 Tax=Sesamum radiatum TaxID=300843 RepID=A0AAW2JXP1_SESRA
MDLGWICINLEACGFKIHCEVEAAIRESLPLFPLPTHKALKKGVMIYEFKVPNDADQNEMPYGSAPSTVFQKFIKLKRHVFLWYYLQVKHACYTKVSASAEVDNPQLVAQSDSVAELLDLDPQARKLDIWHFIPQIPKAVRQCIQWPSNVNNQVRVQSSECISDIVADLKGPNFDLHFRKLPIARRIYCPK